MPTEEKTLSIVVKARNLASGVLGKVSRDVGALGRKVQQGVSSAIGNIAKIGAVAAGAIGFAVHQGLDSLATLEDAMTAVDGAIRQTNNTGKVTAGEIARWANEIESSVQAAFDDKDIVQSTSTLIRYGKLAPGLIRPAMEVMTDLAAKTGSVESASTLMAKALAQPEKAAGKLARAGVILTEEQQKQITAMVEAGDAAGAQALLLDALAEATKGAAAASAGPYRDAQNELRDVVEDTQRALAVGFLPVIKEISGYLKGKMADPSFLAKVQGFGEKLAGFLRDGFEAAKKIPWEQIGSAMKLAGEGAKAAYDIFQGLPDWVKTAVLTGWGLNKLTGGALGGIVGELGKGLVKGVLGMTAGVVHIKAATVTGVGGAAGAGGTAAVGKTGGGVVSSLKVMGSLLIAGVAIEQLFEQWGRFQAQVQEAGASVMDKVATIPDKTYQQALAVVEGMRGTIEAQSGDLVKSLLMTSGTGQGEAIAAFKSLAANLQQTAQTPAERAAAATALTELANTIRTRFTITEGDRLAVDAKLDLGPILEALRNPPPPPPPPPGSEPITPADLDTLATELAGGYAAAIGGLHPDLALLATMLDKNANGTVSLREAVASQLGLTVGELRALKTSSGGWNAALAAKLGISNAELQALLAEARTTVGKLAANKTAIDGVTTAINRKDLSVEVNVSVTSKTIISNRALVSDNYRTTRNSSTVGVV